MGWTDRFRRKPAMESRAEWGSSAIPLPNEGNANTYANVDLRRADASMQKVAVWAAVMLLSRLVGSLPLDTYRRRGDGPPVSIGNSRFIEDPAGDGHGLPDWLAQYMTSKLLRGNVYGKQILGPDAYPNQIVLYHPDTVDGWRDLYTGQVHWYVEGRDVGSTGVWHRRSYPMPGNLLGMSPIGLHMTTIGQGMAAARFGYQFFADGALPTGMLRNTEVAIDPKVAAVAKARWMAAMHGSREVAVMGKGWEYQAIQVAPEESQFLETQKYTAAECARLYGPGVPEILGYETGGSMTYANVDQRSLHLLIYSLDPWLTGLERMFTRMLPQPQFVKFNRSALLRMTTDQRYAAYQIASLIGLQTPNEQRAMEDWAPVPWGDKPWIAAQQAPPPQPGAQEQLALREARGKHSIEEELRDPLTGEWTHGPGSAEKAGKDALKLAGRIKLDDGEHLAGSSKLSTSSGDHDIVMAAIDGKHGREYRIGIVSGGDAEKWTGANKGGTVRIDEDGLKALSSTLTESATKGKKAAKDADKAYENNGDTSQFRQNYLKGAVEGDWGNIVYMAETTDDDPASWALELAVRPDGAPADWEDSTDFATFDPADVRKLAKMLAATPTPESRAQHDSHADIAEEGHDYWVHGEGLAKWAEAPDPWTQLHAHLVKFMDDEEAKRTAAQWFHEVFHFWPGSDVNRVTHGQPPRGKKVGPG